MLLQTFEDLEPLLRTVLVGLRYNAEILQEQNKVYQEKSASCYKTYLLLIIFYCINYVI